MIQYAAIFNKNKVIAEVCSTQPAQFRPLALTIATQAKPGETACVNSATSSTYYTSNGNAIIAIAPKETQAKIVISFLNDVKSKLGDPQKTLEAAYNNVAKYKDQIQLAKNDIDDVKKIMVKNIDEVLQRNERLNLLVDQTSMISQNAHMFNRQSHSLERRMWFANFKLLIMVLLVVFAFLSGLFLLLTH